METTIKIRHTSGGTTEAFATLDEAIAALRSVYGADIAMSDEAPGGEWDHRILVWQDEASSEDDDGARAVASSYRTVR